MKETPESILDKILEEENSSSLPLNHKAPFAGRIFGSYTRLIGQSLRNAFANRVDCQTCGGLCDRTCDNCATCGTD